MSIVVGDYALLSHFFRKKLRFSYILQDFLFGIGIWIWVVESLRSSHHAFVVLSLEIRNLTLPLIQFAGMNVSSKEMRIFVTTI